MGRTVELLRDGKHVRTAVVEDVTRDASIMWLRFSGHDGRALIMQEDGYELRVSG